MEVRLTVNQCAWTSQSDQSVYTTNKCECVVGRGGGREGGRERHTQTDREGGRVAREDMMEGRGGDEREGKKRRRRERQTERI